MKRVSNLLMTLATLLLITVSCQKQENYTPNADGKVTFEVSVPSTATKALGDNVGHIDDLVYAVYRTEAETQEDALANMDQAQLLYAVNQADGETVFANGKTLVTLELLNNQNHIILFWAQVNDTWVKEDPDLLHITYPANLKSNDDNYAAFYGSAFIENVTGTARKSVTLTRPFAQVNVATTLPENYASVVALKNSSVVIENAGKWFSVATGVTMKTNLSFESNVVPNDNNFIVGNETYHHAAMNYIFANGNVVVTYNIETEAHGTITNTIKEVPVEENYRTNIIGSLLTSDVKYDITIDQRFDGAHKVEDFAKGIYINENGEYVITEKDGLYSLANLVNTGVATKAEGNTFAGATFILDTDIDLEGAEWEPIGGNGAVFLGNFDGNDKTISNFKVNNRQSAGLFGAARGVIKNLTVENATIKSNHWGGVIVGYGLCSKVDSCTVKNSSVVLAAEQLESGSWDNGDKAGAVVGYLSAQPEAYVKNCTVENVTVQAYRDLGGVVGYADAKAEVSGNTVSNVALVVDKRQNYKNYDANEDFDAGEIVGEAISGATLENNDPKGVTIKSIGGEDDPGYYKDAEGNYVVTANNGIEAVLDLDEVNVSAKLQSDVTVDVTAWETLAFGGESTETIVIDLEGNTLTFNQTNSDWNNISAQEGLKLTIKNGHITSCGHNDGPWNRHDLNFACDITLENITSDKAIALKNNGTLKNVTIDDKNTSDTYAIWIQPKGQTVTIDGCTIDMLDCTDGRGIKIDNEYVDDEAKVTLNVSNTVFKTEEKPAIIVKTTKGADINISNINIEEVAADNLCAVWVDSAVPESFDLVVVTGACKALEGGGFYVDAEGNYVATTNDGLASVVAKNVSNIYLAEGTFNLPTALSGKSLTLNGFDKEASIIDMSAGTTAQYHAKSVTFKNLTMKRKADAYGGLSHSYAEKYDNCIIEGTLVTYAQLVEVKNSSFVPATTEYYNVHIYEGGTSIFENCTFETNACRAVYAHAESAKEMNISFVGCTFKSNTNADKDYRWHQAIRLHTELGIYGTLNINNCTVDENGNFNPAYNGGLWVEWNNGTKELTNNFETTVDGLTFVAPGVWKNTNDEYVVSSRDMLQAVLTYTNENITGAATIAVLSDLEGDVTAVQKEGLKITINGGNYSYKGVITVDGKSAAYPNAGLTINNLNFDAESISNDACISLGKSGDNDTRYTSNVTIVNCTFDVPGAVGIKSYTGGDKKLTIKKCTATANAHSLLQAAGIYGILVEESFAYSGNGMNFNQSDDVAIYNYTADVKGYAVRFGASSGETGVAEKYLIKNSTLKSACEDGDAVIILRGTAEGATLTLENTTIEGTTHITNSANATIIQ